MVVGGVAVSLPVISETPESPDILSVLSAGETEQLLKPKTSITKANAQSLLFMRITLH